MKKYIVSVDFEVEAASAEGASEQMQLAIGNAIDALNQELMGEDALILESGVYAEPYTLHTGDCMFDHDHAQGGCEVRD
jgi:hypothetical protein